MTSDVIPRLLPLCVAPMRRRARARARLARAGIPYRGTLRSEALDRVRLMRGLIGTGPARGPGS